MADLPSREIEVFDLTVADDRDRYAEFIADKPVIIAEHDVPMRTGAILRVVDFREAKPPLLSDYQPPIC